MNRSRKPSIWPRPLITLFVAIALTFGWIILLDSAVLTAPAKHGTIPSSAKRSAQPAIELNLRKMLEH